MSLLLHFITLWGEYTFGGNFVREKLSNTDPFFFPFCRRIFAFWRTGENRFFSCLPITSTLSPCLFALQSLPQCLCWSCVATVSRSSIKLLWKFCLNPRWVWFAFVCLEAEGPWHFFWYQCVWESKQCFFLNDTQVWRNTIKFRF